MISPRQIDETIDAVDTNAILAMKYMLLPLLLPLPPLRLLRFDGEVKDCCGGGGGGGGDADD